jgi:SpoVK/Ycf46/Vps4 family AAA+-type ATPase
MTINKSGSWYKTRKRKRTPEINASMDTPPIHPTNLKTLIALCVHCKTSRDRFMDCENLSALLEPLQELEQMVGLFGIKQSIVDFVLLNLQSTSISLPNMRHLIIAGPPGCGKTTVSTIIAKVLTRLQLCQTDKIVFGTQANMIGGFLGQTAPKTEELIRSAFGGVLFIDEASSLADGRSEQNSDSFSKSCIDTLNRMLSEHGDKFVCILAGYKTEIYRDILSINPGMDRRFATRFEITTYTPEELMEIMHRQFLIRKTTLAGLIPLTWIKQNISRFGNAGGDCMTLVDCIIVEHAKRSFGSTGKNRLVQIDIDTGLRTFLSRQIQKSPNDVPESLRCMYT